MEEFALSNVMSQVSVPLRGRGFERIAQMQDRQNDWRDYGFPSPYGEEVLKVE